MKKRFDHLHGRVKLFVSSRCSWRKAKEENRCKNDGKKTLFSFLKVFFDWNRIGKCFCFLKFEYD